MTQDTQSDASNVASTFSDVSFDDFELHDSVRQGLIDAGFKQCTPIQALCLPLALAGKDVAGQGQTGRIVRFDYVFYSKLSKE